MTSTDSALASASIPCDIPSKANYSDDRCRIKAASESPSGRAYVLTTISKAFDLAIQSFKEIAREHLAKQVAAHIAETIQGFTSSKIRTGQRLKALENTTDNRIFVRLPEGHASRQHHVHAVKAALTQKLGLNVRPVKGVQIAAQILEKAPEITVVIGSIVEKAEK
ncbi:hypothetical protein EPUL_005097, partial [Erysiphe pulchra]